jgi:2-methylcitrate dehydratase PrpD
LLAGGQLPRAAALVNGTAAHAVEADHSFRDAMFHPGAAVAAALAVAQETGAAGEEFLRAVVCGYELSSRIALVLGRAHSTFWHATGTVGTFGAAAASSHLLGLDEERFAHALATAATFAAGLQQAFHLDSMSKPLHAGRAAEAGLLAAQLARSGVTGSLDVLDGKVGLGRAMGDGPDWSQAARMPSQDFHITRLSFKTHIGCGHAFAAIDGALELQRRFHIAPDDIAAVHVSTYRAALEVAHHQQPTTAHEARFSMAYLVAAALTRGPVRLRAYAPDQWSAADTRALMGRIHLRVDPELEAAFPGKREARVEIVTRGARRYTHLQAHRKGDPELPLTDGELESKFLELASPAIGGKDADRLLSRLWRLDASDAPDLAQLPGGR